MSSQPSTAATGAIDSRPRVLTVEEWADQMRISRGTAYAAVKNGDVKVIRIGRLIRIPNPATAA